MHSPGDGEKTPASDRSIRLVELLSAALERKLTRPEAVGMEQVDSAADLSVHVEAILGKGEDQ